MNQRVDKDSLPLDQPRRTPNHPTKSHIVKTKVDGKEKIIRFGEQGAETAGKPKAGESDRMKQKRASFKARHAKNIAKGKSSPAYWANKVKWAEGGEVKMARGGNAAMAMLEQMKRAGAQTQEFDPVLVAMREQRARPARRPAPQARVPQAAPEMREAPLPLPPIPPSMRPDENPPPEAAPNPMRFDEGNPHVATAIQMAERYGLPRDIFLSLVQQESGFDPNARSRRGAIGLGQLMPGTARELGVDPTDPVQNLEGSARYLRQMLDRFGDMPLALAAYNAGPGTVRRAGNTIPNIRETQRYVPSILRRAGANVPEGLADLEQKYAEGGAVMSDEEYDRRLLSRMKAQTGRVTEPTRAEQMQALRTAGSEAAQLAADVLLPQSPLDAALMVALGPGGRAARLAGAGALAALEPSEAQASRLRRLIRAYHGSPHQFDEFDIRKIGTGEGNQAFGRGLYFAENEGIAKHYRDKLTNLGDDIQIGNYSYNPADIRRYKENPAEIEKDLQYVRQYLTSDSINRSRSTLDLKLLNRLRQLEALRDIPASSLPEVPRGHMYEVDLNANPQEFLNWDLPLSQQSREVQESLGQFGIWLDPEAVDEYRQLLLRVGNTRGPKPRLPEFPDFSPDPTGQEIYQRVLGMDPEEARIALMEVGIPGTRYLDANSRAFGGTHNYAVFDPEIIDIQRRYARGGLVDLEQKYAEGGQVDTGPAQYDPAAVDALVKQIEAEYV